MRIDGDNSRINLANPLGERGPSGYNQPLNDILSIVYDLPYGKGRMFGGSAPLHDAGGARRLADHGDQQRQQRSARQHHLLAQQLSAGQPAARSAP